MQQEVRLLRAIGTLRFLVLLAITGVFLLVIANIGSAGQQSTDNTRVNRQEQNRNGVTADQQGKNSSDRKITQQIRESITKDKNLSTYGHNVKVVTQNGTVTLKGPVRSDEEKKAIEAKATEIAGPGNVNSELTVSPETK